MKQHLLLMSGMHPELGRDQGGLPLERRYPPGITGYRQHP